MSLLWELTGKSGSISYLYGTMHLQNDSAYTFVDQIKEVILTKPRFYGETDIDGLRNNAELSQHYLLPNNLTLIDAVGIKKYTKWKIRVAKHFGVNLDDFKRFIPFYIYNNLQVSLLPKSNKLPLDGYLWDFAKAHNREFVGLETVDQQMETLSGISLSYQYQQLAAFLKMPNQSKKRVEYLSKHYEEQHIHKLYAASKKDIGGLRGLLLYSRNRRMADTILRTLDIPSVYTFGAAHFSGEKGIIHLLKSQGAQLKPVSM